ncbi:hypothetical protein M3Y96_01193800 [Aphelenchoides besseyi]|nr:hypothetical protein M3Y96_01193800 [Aphelenchoides besseyi]
MVFLAIALGFGVFWFTMIHCCINKELHSGVYDFTSTAFGNNIKVVLTNDTKNNKYSSWQFLYRRSILIGGFLMSLIMAILSYRLTKKRSVNVLSTRAKMMLQEFKLTLYLKNIVPGITTIVPLSSKIILSTFNMESWILGEVTSAMNAWIPFINSLTVLLLITCYRRTLIRALRIFGFQSNSVQRITSSFNVTTRGNV